MKLLKILTSLLVVAMCGAAFASPACNHDVDPTDKGRLQRDLAAGNLSSQRFVPVGTEITMGYGKKGEKITCTTTTQRLYVTTKEGVEYDAGCGNVIFSSSPLTSAAKQTKPETSDTVKVDECDNICQEKKNCDSINGTWLPQDNGVYTCRRKVTVLNVTEIDVQNVTKVNSLANVGPAEVNHPPAKVALNLSGAELDVRRNQPQVKQTSPCEHLMGMLILSSGQRQIRAIEGVRKVAIRSPSRGDVWVSVDNFNAQLKHCGCALI